MQSSSFAAPSVAHVCVQLSAILTGCDGENEDNENADNDTQNNNNEDNNNEDNNEVNQNQFKVFYFRTISHSCDVL